MVNLHLISSFKAAPLRNAIYGPRNTTCLPIWRGTSFGRYVRNAVAAAEVTPAAGTAKTKKRDNLSNSAPRSRNCRRS